MSFILNLFVSHLEKFKQFDYLWNQVDEDKFIFYKSNIYGKLSKTRKCQKLFRIWWNVLQYMFERDGINTENDHPNTYGQKIWGDYLKEQYLKKYNMIVVTSFCSFTNCGKSCLISY